MGKLIDFDGLLPALDRFAKGNHGPALLKGALLLETQIKAHAQGRPGPRAPTGDYLGSWNTRLINSGTDPVAVVGTNAPQGRRLEFGFTGRDSLGRNYNQPPYPHVEPAIAESQDRIVELITNEIIKNF